MYTYAVTYDNCRACQIKVLILQGWLQQRQQQHEVFRCLFLCQKEDNALRLHVLHSPEVHSGQRQSAERDPAYFHLPEDYKKSALPLVAAHHDTLL